MTKHHNIIGEMSICSRREEDTERLPSNQSFFCACRPIQKATRSHVRDPTSMGIVAKVNFPSATQPSISMPQIVIPHNQRSHVFGNGRRLVVVSPVSSSTRIILVTSITGMVGVPCPIFIVVLVVDSICNNNNRG